MERRIAIVAAVVVDDAGRTLLVRKRNTSAFVQPGGKIGDAETPLDALHREIREELGCEIEHDSVRYVGRFEAPAANEQDAIVDAELFICRLIGEPTPLEEIEETLWIELNVVYLDVCLAPLTSRYVLPWLRTPSETTSSR